MAAKPASQALSPSTAQAPFAMAIVAAPSHVLITLNPAFCRFANQAEEHLAGKPFHEVLGERAECVALLDRVHRSGISESYLEQDHAASRTTFWSYTMWPVVAHEPTIGVMIQTIEMTPLYEKTLAMNEALVVGSLRQHELTAAANLWNTELQAETGDHKQRELDAWMLTNEISHKMGVQIRDRIAAELTAERLRLEVAQLSAIDAEHAAHERALESANADLQQLSSDLVTARDAAERANRAKSRFLAGMSHELRTPLNGILGYAHLLHIEGGLNHTQDGRVNAMLQAGKHLLELITRVLDLSEIETEHAELQSVSFDVQAAALACVDLVRPTAEAKGLTLGMAAAPDAPRELVGDPTRLRQILVNLLGNAAKFTNQGTVELHVLLAASGSALRFEVADTGPGISAGHRQNLFQDFERLDTVSTRTVEGAGLGLAISNRLAKLMGGSLGHDDNPGGGSMFWLELPLGTVALPFPATAPAVDLADPEPALAPARPLHVLVVDDVLMNRDIASSFLRMFGHKVTCVEGGAEAIAAVAAAAFDVVLMDVRMPEMDGLEATRRIRAHEGTNNRVPIIALTAQAFTEQVAECREAGMDSHLAKPFDPDTLLAAVMRAAGIQPSSI
jgi:signal transduction histidine kinase/ActR/RegA family two-component response regulator